MPTSQKRSNSTSSTSNREPVSADDLRSIDRRLFWRGVWILAGAFLLTRLIASDFGDQWTRNTIRLSLAWYAVSLFQMILLRPGDWSAQTMPGRVTRWNWTWGFVAFMAHIVAAFHFFHKWSHAAAWQHTQEDAGVGDGVYATYLFAAVWLVDVAWWWLLPEGYARRSVWVARSLYLWMLFIVFNGAVVFETGTTRWASAVGFTLLFWFWGITKLEAEPDRTEEKETPPQTPGAGHLRRR